MCVCVCVCACVCVCVCNLGKEREGRRQQLPHLSCGALLRSPGLLLQSPVLQLWRHAVAPGSHCGGLQSQRPCSRLQFQRHVIAAACNCGSLQLQHPAIAAPADCGCILVAAAPASRASCNCRVLQSQPLQQPSQPPSLRARAPAVEGRRRDCGATYARPSYARVHGRHMHVCMIAAIHIRMAAARRRRGPPPQSRARKARLRARKTAMAQDQHRNCFSEFFSWSCAAIAREKDAVAREKDRHGAQERGGGDASEAERCGGGGARYYIYNII